MANQDSTADRSAYFKAWREANKEKLREYNRKRYQERRDEIRAQQAAYYAENKDRAIERAKRWAEENCQRRVEINNEWRRRNPEWRRESNRITRERHGEKYAVSGKEYRLRNPEKVKDARRRWNEANPWASAHHVGLRRSRLLRATPEWADINAIKSIYREASELSRETGVQHHVDHIYPLKGRKVCGLHNEFNLQILTATENMSKHAKMPD